MTRLLGYFSNQADRFPCALVAEEDVLAPTAPLGAEAWGVGSFQAGEVLLRKKPTDVRADVTLLDLTRDLRTSCAVVHLRDGAVGARTLENTPPFRYRQWLFAHHGNLPDFSSHRRDFVDALPDFLQRAMRGDTDGEVLFYSFLSEVFATGRLDDPEFDRAAIIAALDRTVASVDGRFGVGGGFNLVATNGFAMVALRRGPPMAWVRRQGIRACKRCERPGEYASRPARVAVHDALKYVIVASQAEASGKGWQHLPESPRGTVVAIDRQLDVQTAAL
jgi:predicted glutamine amidotransferase